LAPELAGHDPPRLRVAQAQLQGEKSAGLALAFHPHSTEAVKFFATNDTTCYKDAGRSCQFSPVKWGKCLLIALVKPRLEKQMDHSTTCE